MIMPISEMYLKIKGKWIKIKFKRPICASEILKRYGYQAKKGGTE